MLNLLPKDSKKIIRGEYLRRFFVVLLISLTFIDVFLLVAIFPTYISVKTEQKIAIDMDKSIDSSSDSKRRNEALQRLKDLDVKLKAIEMISDEKPLSYIDKALELKTKGISINNISYTKKDLLKRDVLIEGVASSRASLIEFSKKIKSSDWTSFTDIPISNLVNDKNIRFSVTLTSTNKTK